MLFCNNYMLPQRGNGTQWQLISDTKHKLVFDKGGLGWIRTSLPPPPPNTHTGGGEGWYRCRVFMSTGCPCGENIDPIRDIDFTLTSILCSCTLEHACHITAPMDSNACINQIFVRVTPVTPTCPSSNEMSKTLTMSRRLHQNSLKCKGRWLK